MSLTNNKIKSTTIYGALNVVDMADGSILANTNLSRDLTVAGKINNIPATTINYISNLTSDAQTQISSKANSTDLTALNTNISALQTKTTDISYNSLTLTTTHVNNLIVSGNINSVPFSKFDFLKNITSDIQTQISSKANSSDLTTSNNNIATANTNISALQTKTTDISYNSLTLTTTHANNLIVSGNINSVPYAKFPYLSNITSDIQAQINNINLSTSGCALLSANNTFTGTTNTFKTVKATETIWTDIQSQGYYGGIGQSGQALELHSQNELFSGTAGTQLATGINFYCYDSAKVQKNIFNLTSNGAVLNGALYADTIHSVNGLTTWDSGQSANTSYANYIYQGGSIMTILVRNINLTTPSATQLQFSLYDEAKTQQNPMTINPTSVNINGTLTVNNSPIITPITEGSITSASQNGPNTTGLSYSFVLSPYYSDSISVSCPIASSESGSFNPSPISITNTITSISCTINKNGSFFSNSLVETNQTLPLTKITTVAGNQGTNGFYLYNFKQYLVNANASFQPTYENASSTYTVTFAVSGTGNFQYNTTTRQIFSV